jgi:hypothetical protein
MGYQTTNGVQAAFGVSLGRSLKKKHEVRLGIGPKLLWRRGGYQTLPTMTLLNMNMGKLSQVTGPFGRGFGVDLGAQYLFYLNSRFTLSYGIAYTDVGDTTFDSIAQRIKGNLSNGVAATYNLGRGKISMIYDYRHVLDDTDWRKKNHVGLEVQMPFISIYGGINQVYYTYGAAFDVWLFRITGFSYAEEHGSFAHQNPERRYGMRAGLKFDL